MSEIESMLRSRQHGKPCPVHGANPSCEVSQERSVRNRTQDRRQWRTETVISRSYVEHEGLILILANESTQYLHEPGPASFLEDSWA